MKHLSRVLTVAADCWIFSPYPLEIREKEPKNHFLHFLSQRLCVVIVSAPFTLCSYVATCDDIVQSISVSGPNYFEIENVKRRTVNKQGAKPWEIICLSSGVARSSRSVLCFSVSVYKGEQENMKIKAVNKFCWANKVNQNKDVSCYLSEKWELWKFVMSSSVVVVVGGWKTLWEQIEKFYFLRSNACLGAPPH